MSRVGEKPIPVPEGISVSIDGNKITVTGPKGTLEKDFHSDITIKNEKGVLMVERSSDSRTDRSLHGTSRALLANMVNGVSTGYSKALQVNGIGYTAIMEGNRLKLALGFSHDIYFEPPGGIEISSSRNAIMISGIDKQLVGQVAAKIRSFRPPEPYKGKGIRYRDEYVRTKKGKTVGGTEGI